jgi:hypothetical protein
MGRLHKCSEVDWRGGHGEVTVHQSVKIWKVTVLVYSMLIFLFLLLQFIYYYYLNYLKLINGTYISNVLGGVQVALSRFDVSPCSLQLTTELGED